MPCGSGRGCSQHEVRLLPRARARVEAASVGRRLGARVQGERPLPRRQPSRSLLVGRGLLPLRHCPDAPTADGRPVRRPLGLRPLARAASRRERPGTCRDRRALEHAGPRLSPGASRRGAAARPARLRREQLHRRLSGRRLRPAAGDDDDHRRHRPAAAAARADGALRHRGPHRGTARPGPGPGQPARSRPPLALGRRARESRSC